MNIIGDRQAAATQATRRRVRRCHAILLINARIVHLIYSLPCGTVVVIIVVVAVGFVIPNTIEIDRLADEFLLLRVLLLSF